jgi:hypothetical protein
MSEDNFSDEFVPAVFARNEEDAEKYRKLLEDHDIEAVVGYDELENHLDTNVVSGGVAHGLPVLVLESLLDEASQIIADREDLDEFEADDEESDEDDEDEVFDLELDEEGRFEVEADASASESHGEEGDSGGLPEEDRPSDDGEFDGEDDEDIP